MLAPSKPQYSDLTSARYMGYNDGLSKWAHDIDYNSCSPEVLWQLLNNEMMKATKTPKKIEAQIKGHQFLVVGNDSYNLEQLTKFEVKECQLVLVLGALTYVIYEQNVKNFNDIPDIIYSYFEHKHGKNISNG